jgi:beta-N-acetylhexosaminidase
MLRRAVAALSLAVVLPLTSASLARAADDGAASGSGADSIRIVPAAELDGADAAFEAQVAARVSAMDTREKAASVVMGHIPTTDPAAAAAYMRDNALGGFILMGANVPADDAALRALTSALEGDPAFPALRAVDEEGGDVERLRGDVFGDARSLKAASPEETRAAFAARGALVAEAGIDVNFGVVADVTDDASMFIYRRALGTTPEEAAERVAAAVEGEAPFAASTLKHFPGHGAAPGDSHNGIPQTSVSLEQWRAHDAEPFLAGIDAGAPLLMFGHLRYTAVDDAPASLSATWHRIAREELGFEGVAITDDLGMLQASGEARYADPVANAVSALAAGNDMVLAVMFSDAGSAGRIVDGIGSAVDSGALPAERLDEAATRVAALRMQTAAAGGGFAPCADCAPVG